MEENGKVDKIISQATQWSFEGDCSLLAWMQELSQHIEQRATTTNDALQQLNINVNRTAIALDNAANSLTALQYTQFVESRCHDDDETQTNIKEAEAGAVATSLQSSVKTKSPKEVMEIFLQKNLQMLHSCHEKYALDFEDSDEDDNTNSHNYIYQPKNPYNDALLPHIYGSKLWKEHWHVGLCDGSNEYSGDEASDAFSETSSSSAADNESYESNTANLSEWASSTSIPIEHKHPALMVGQKEHALPASATAAARNKHLPSNDDSDTCSTTSRSTTTNPPFRTREHDLFATLRHDTSITSTSTSSSPQQHIAATIQAQRVSAPISSTIAPFFDATPPTDIFADAAMEPQPNRRNENETTQKSAVGQIKRKPVNLFDDDDFNSFMTEVVDKAQTKVAQKQQQQPPQMPVSASNSLPSGSANNLPPPRTVDLFAEPPSIKTPTTNEATSPIAIEKPKETSTRKPVNLFDSPEGSPQSDSLFTANDKKAEPVIEKPKDITPTAAKPSITAKSLFDDDDDDDDFLNVFGAKKLNLPQRSTGKTLLFDDDNEEVTRQPMNTRTTSNLFDDTPPAEDFAPTTAIFKENNNNNKTNNSYTVNGSVGSAVQENNATPSFEAEVSRNMTTTTVTSTNSISNSQLAHSPPVNPVSRPFSANLFADDENDDLDELFSKKSTKQQPAKTANNEPNKNVHEKVATTKPMTNASAPQKKSLFGDDLVDDDDDILFGKPTKFDENKASLRVENRTGGILKSASLFGDDFDDEADDLFGVTSAKKVITSTAVSKDEPEIASIKDEMTQVLVEQKENKSSIQQSTETEVVGAVKNVSPQKSLFEYDDLANALSDVDKVKEDSNDIMNEVKVLASHVEKESAELKPPAVNGLFGENVADVSKKTPKTLISDVTAEQFVDNAEDNVENLKTTLAEVKNSTVDTLSSIQKSTPNKEEIKEVETFAETWKHDENNAENQLDPISEHTAEQPEKLETPLHTSKPIEEVVDLTADTMQDRENTAGQQKYASIFLDEPPDDDDFFTTLSNNTKPLSVSKLTLDLESDFYEPALPQVPNSARTTTTATTTNTQAGASDYGGLRLFSEIPPDDDDDEEDDFNFNSSKHSKQAADNGAGVNQRLHSVFYDDFTETLEAVQQIKENKIAAHALFDDEPPPVEEPFAVGAVETLKKLVETTTAAKADTHKSEIGQEKGYSKAESSKDVTDRAMPKLEGTAIATAPEKPRATAGKLQMPNIKINVQALLPGGGGRPSFKKSPTTPADATHTAATSEISKLHPAADLSKATSNASLKSTVSTESANESLLSSVCKTRVRAPAGRRPSTRRARQENYRQSLVAEKADHIVLDADFEAASSSNQITPKPTYQIENESRTVPATSSSVVKALANISIPKPTNLFLDENADVDDYDTLFKPTPTTSAQTSNNVKQALIIKTTNDLREQGPALQANSTRETTKSNVDFGESDGDDDDDLFKSARIAPASAALKPVNNSKAAIITTPTTQSVPPTMPATKSLFANTPSEDSDDELFKSSKSLLSTATRTTTKVASPLTTTATPAASASRATVEPKTKTEGKLDSIFGSDDEDDDFLSQLKPKNKTTTSLLTASAVSSAKPSSSGSAGLFSDIESDEDDLFGAKSKTKPNTFGKTKAATTTMASTSNKQKPITTKQQPLDKHKTLADNPLADLLNP
nr:WASH complex subunit 2 isoform X1 [Bactrocera oleae]